MPISTACSSRRRRARRNSPFTEPLAPVLRGEGLGVRGAFFSKVQPPPPRPLSPGGERGEMQLPQAENNTKEIQHALVCANTGILPDRDRAVRARIGGRTEKGRPGAHPRDLRRSRHERAL